MSVGKDRNNLIYFSNEGNASNLKKLLQQNWVIAILIFAMRIKDIYRIISSD